MKSPTLYTPTIHLDKLSARIILEPCPYIAIVLPKFTSPNRRDPQDHIERAIRDNKKLGRMPMPAAVYLPFDLCHTRWLRNRAVGQAHLVVIGCYWQVQELRDIIRHCIQVAVEVQQQAAVNGLLIRQREQYYIIGEGALLAVFFERYIALLTRVAISLLVALEWSGVTSRPSRCMCAGAGIGTRAA